MFLVMTSKDSVVRSKGVVSGAGAILEKIVLGRSKKLFEHNSHSNTNDLRRWAFNPQDIERGSATGTGPQTGIWWWSPPPNAIPVEFCRETSIHGLKFIFREKSHLSERLGQFSPFFYISRVLMFFQDFLGYSSHP